MRERVLIVEDNKSLAKLIAKKMNANVDMDIVVAHSYADAINIIEDNDDFFIALLDLNLPDAPDGEIVDYVLSKNILAIVLTGSVDENLKKIFLQKNIVDYVLKDSLDAINYIFDTINRLCRNRNSKVMIVEPSMSVRNQLKEILNSQLYKVFTAAHGEEALNYLEDNPDIKLVLTAYNMPVIDGFELMHQIRQTKDKNHLGLIAVASSDSDVAAKFLKNGANDFISVPFSKEEIIYTVDSNLKAMQYENDIQMYKKYDPLTKLFNRRYFFAYAKSLAAKNSEFAIAILDIDGLRKINAEFGFELCDRVIIHVASILKNDLKGVVIARLSGGEFGVILDKISFDDAIKIMAQIRSKIANLTIASSITTTISVGICNFDGDIKFDHAIMNGYKALEKAKKSGKNRIEIL